MTNGNQGANQGANRGNGGNSADTVQIRGSIPAIITPMLEDGSLDLPAFRKLIDWHIAEGTDALVVVGTSGESATLSVEEHVLMVKTAVEHTAGRIPVIAGSGGNSTTEAIELTQQAKDVGADATLQVVPYYNKPTQEGIYRHFAKIAETVDLPVILYNVPGRTVADMSNETILRCAQVPGIVGVKEATGNIDRAAHLIKSAPAHFGIYSGDDPTAIALMLLGGHANKKDRHRHSINRRRSSPRSRHTEPGTAFQHHEGPHETFRTFPPRNTHGGAGACPDDARRL
jgi:4-hydroxy-tetrahydrodipicolinate synthase